VNTRRLLLVPLWFIVSLATFLGLGTSSAAASSGPETRVRANSTVVETGVAANSSERPGSVGCLRPPQPESVVGACVATEAERLAGRVDDFHSALDPIAQNSRTTSVMSTRQGTDIVSSGGRDLSPAQRALAQEGDVLGRLPGAHAEVTALNAATKAGLTPAQIAVSRPICGSCQAVIQGSGGEILPGGMGAFWPG
jgi:hypothetical protein